MNDDAPETDDEAPDARPPLLKSGAVWLAGKVRDHFVSLAIAAAVGFGAGIFFGKDTAQRVQQNMFGAHCARDIFNLAKKGGTSLTFEPASIEYMAICNPGAFRGASALDILKSYTETYQPNCLKMAESDGGFVIKPAEGEDVIAHEISDGDPFFTCRCKPEQALVMFKYESELCGAKTPQADDWQKAFENAL